MKSYLLDTHTFLWWAFDSPELSPTARSIISDPTNDILLSSASAWEIATKFRLGRLPDAAPLLDDLPGWVHRAGFRELSICLEHARRAGSFPHPHRDPFDRMIAAQSIVECVPVVGLDEALLAFGADLVW